MNYKYLIRKDYVLDGGIKNEEDKTIIIPFEELSVKTGSADPDGKDRVLTTEKLVEELIDNSIASAHKQIKGDATAKDYAAMEALVSIFNSGGDLVLDDGSLYNNKPNDATNPNGAQEGDIVNFIPTDANLEIEEGYVLKSLQMKLTNNNGKDKRLTDLEANDKVQDTDIQTLQTADTSNLKQDNAKDIIAKGVIIADSSNVTNPSLIPTRQEVGQMGATLKQDIDSAASVAGTANGLATDALARLDQVEPKVTTNTAGIATNVTNIATNVTNITKNANDITANKTEADANKVEADATKAVADKAASDIVILKGEDTNHDGRIQALEDAETLDDKVWEGSIAGADSVDLSTIVDQNGNPFDFANGKKLEVVIEKSSAQLEQAHDLVTGAANATPYVLGTKSLTAKLGVDGHLTITPDSGAAVTDFNVIKVVEARAVKAVSVAYSKAESDAKYTLKTTTAALDTRIVANKSEADKLQIRMAAAETKGTTNATNIAKNVTDIATNKATGVTNAAQGKANETSIAANGAEIAKNTTAINAKQDKVDNSLSTSTKSVVGAINELKTRLDNQPIKDLTHLTSQDELYNAVELGDVVKLSVSGNVSTYSVNRKNASVASLYGVIGNSSANNQSVVCVVSAGNNGTPINTVITMKVGSPTADSDAATKKYVDDAVASSGVPAPLIIDSDKPIGFYYNEISEAIDRGDMVTHNHRVVLAAEKLLNNAFIYGLDDLFKISDIHDSPANDNNGKLIIGQLYK